jgi:hypothetical protein
VAVTASAQRSSPHVADRGDLLPPPALGWHVARRRLAHSFATRPTVVTARHFTENPDDDAATVIDHGWQLEGFPRIPLEPIAWEQAARAHRSWGFRLHTWSFLDPVVREYLDTGAQDLLAWCVRVAGSWVRAHQAGNEPGDDGGAMAWYDMALSLRAPRLAWLLRTALTSGESLPDGQVEVLYQAVLAHQRALGRAAAYNGRNNHGFYTAVGQMVLAREMRPLPGMARLHAQGRARLADIAGRQFLPDGGHAEHSPGYHQMLLRDFRLAQDLGLVTDPAVRRRLERARSVLDWMVQPDGHLVQFGDTADLATDARPDRSDRGDVEAVAFPESGYAFARAGRRRDGEMYLAQTAAFHSRAHKHADDGAVVWHDRGHEWLVDGGRFGYAELLPADSPLRARGFYYGTPERQYVESSTAHTTVTCDRQDHERRARTPYGSGIVDAQVRDGHVRLRSAVDHGHWTHRRSVVALPGRWLLLLDQVDSSDTGGHVFQTWLNLPGDAGVVREADRLRVARTDPEAVLWIQSWGEGDHLIRPVRGETGPPLRGWRSVQDRQLVPAWSTGYESGPTGHHLFRVLLHHGDHPAAGVPEHPFDTER